MPRRRAALVLAVGLTTSLLLAGCPSVGGTAAPTGAPGTSAPCAATTEGPVRRATQPGELRVLIGSELADLRPLLTEVADATGVRMVFTEVGTLDAIEQVAAGTTASQHALWVSSNAYLGLHPGAQARVATQVKVMRSPVILAVRESAAVRLGWTAERRPSWKEISDKAAAGEFTFGMSDPAASNSGFAALVAIASGQADTAAALTLADIGRTAVRLQAMFQAQKLTAGSSGWLRDAFVERERRNDPVDAMFNYESVLLALNASPDRREKLRLVYPSDGAVYADYPFSLLAGADAATRDRYDTVAAYFGRCDVQRKVMAQTYRRPMHPDAGEAATFSAGPLATLPLPNQADVVRTLVDAYQNKLRPAGRTVYVLDTSGSMEGERIESLKAALRGLTGADTSLSGQLSQFRGREEITLLPFSSRPGTPQKFVVPEQNRDATLNQIRTAISRLPATGDTAIYDALVRAYELLGPIDPTRLTSIVLLSDGEQRKGRNFAAFEQYHRKLPAAARQVPVCVVLFGEANVGEMRKLAELTGGRAFDARGVPLANIFQEIRGCQ